VEGRELSKAIALVGRSEAGGSDEVDSVRLLFALVCDFGSVPSGSLFELLVSSMSRLRIALLLPLSVSWK
jgi:hypothetical protein